MFDSRCVEVVRYGDKLIVGAEQQTAAWLLEHARIDRPIGDAARELVIVVIGALDGEHVLVASPTGWQLEHTVRCRLRGVDCCEVRAGLRDQLAVGPAPLPGRYLIRWQRERPHWHLIPEPADDDPPSEPPAVTGPIL